MTNTKDDGGAAFPRHSVPGTITQDGGRERHTPFIPAQDGMSLRDYFAAQALQGDLSTAETSDAIVCQKLEFSKLMAERAYSFADAMIEARKPKE